MQTFSVSGASSFDGSVIRDVIASDPFEARAVVDVLRRVPAGHDRVLALIAAYFPGDTREELDRFWGHLPRVERPRNARGLTPCGFAYEIQTSGRYPHAATFGADTEEEARAIARRISNHPGAGRVAVMRDMQNGALAVFQDGEEIQIRTHNWDGSKIDR